MLKYRYLDDQTLTVTGKLRFFTQSHAMGCGGFVLIVSALIAFVVYGLLAYLKVGGWLQKYFGPDAGGGYIFFVVMCFIVFRFLDALCGPKLSVNRDGRITSRMGVLGLVLSTTTFETGTYKFLVEETHQDLR